MKRYAALLVAALCTVSLPAAAHAFLTKASPAAGQILKTGPSLLALRFSEALEPAFSGAMVTNADGQDMGAAASLTNGNDMSVMLKSLPAGLYRVSWHAVAVDSHRTEGSYTFRVQQ